MNTVYAASGVGGTIRRKRGHQPIGRGDRQQLRDVACLAGKKPHRRTDAARPGVPDKCLQRREPGDADMDGKPIALGLDAPVPRDDRCGLETELGNDEHGSAGAFGERVLPGERRADSGVRNVGAALGMSGDTDASDPILVEQPGVEELHGVGILPKRLADRAADEQHLIDAGVAGEARQILFEKCSARDGPGGEVGDRIEPFATQTDSDRDGVFEHRPREKGDVDGCPGRQMDAVVRDLRCRGGGRLGGEVRQQFDDRLLRGRLRADAPEVSGTLRHLDALSGEPRSPRSVRAARSLHPCVRESPGLIPRVASPGPEVPLRPLQFLCVVPVEGDRRRVEIADFLVVAGQHSEPVAGRTGPFVVRNGAIGDPVVRVLVCEHQVH